jgi:calcineurin-like phosphoesterase
MTAQLKAILASYARSFLGAGVAVYATGNTDWRAILVAGLSAVIPVALRALNSKDPAFGIGADILVVELSKLAKPSEKKTNAKKTAK